MNQKILKEIEMNPTCVVIVKQDRLFVVSGELPGVRLEFGRQILVKKKGLEAQFGREGGRCQVAQVSPNKRPNLIDLFVVEEVFHLQDGRVVGAFHDDEVQSEADLGVFAAVGQHFPDLVVVFGRARRVPHRLQSGHSDLGRVVALDAVDHRVPVASADGRSDVGQRLESQEDLFAFLSRSRLARAAQRLSQFGNEGQDLRRASGRNAELSRQR